MLETAGEAALEVGVPLRDVRIRPQPVAKIKLVGVSPPFRESIPQHCEPGGMTYTLAHG
jgi:hypothetical protein